MKQAVKKAVFTIGIPGSGKSTWARQFLATEQAKNPDAACVEINRDNIREQLVKEKLPNAVGINLWQHWKWKWEKDVTKIENQLIDGAIAHAAGSTRDTYVVISNMNINEKTRVSMQAKFRDAGFDIEEQLFPISYTEAVRRDTYRANTVGADVVYKMYRQYQEQFGNQRKPEVGTNKRKAILVDVDGTLAHMNGRSPYDWKRVGEDSPDKLVIQIVRALCMAHYSIIVMSGRDSVCRQETYDWLIANNVPFTELFMRAQDDMRHDNIVKEELFWNHVDPTYEIVGVIDDRPQVCRMWRDLGLKTIQVGDPELEF